MEGRLVALLAPGRPRLSRGGARLLTSRGRGAAAHQWAALKPGAGGGALLLALAALARTPPSAIRRLFPPSAAAAASALLCPVPATAPLAAVGAGAAGTGRAAAANGVS